MKKILLILLTATTIFASQCHYDFKSLQVNWKAYKTPLKIGVGGTFNNVSINAIDKSSTKNFLTSSTVVINTATINSKNVARDKKLVHYFFNIQGVKKINIKVLSVNKEKIYLDITMNGVTRTVPMRLDLKDDEAKADGYIDLADFHMLPSLAAITKACYKLHQGKTWQDVKIDFTLKTQKNCH